MQSGMEYLNDEAGVDAGAVTTDLSIVIPVYNGADSLPELALRLEEVFRDRPESYEVILVDDDSEDGSWRVLEQLHARNRRFKPIQLMRNAGQFRAILCGLRNASGEVVVTMDDDLQHPPEEIPKLLDALDSSPEKDCIIGAARDKQHSAIRNIGSYVIRRFNQVIFKVPAGIRMGSFRAIRRPLVDAMITSRRVTLTIGPLILSCTRRLGNVEVEHAPRACHRSNYTWRRLVSTTLDNVIGYSTFPLRLAAGIGVFVSILSMAYGFYRFLAYFIVGTQVPGWTSLVVLLSFFCGVILYCIALLGEYVIRIIRELDSNSQYYIRNRRT